jgi:hypothetical protein
VASLHLPTGLPAPVAHLARQSVGAANTVAAELPAPWPGRSAAAFRSGMDWALVIAAGVAMLAAVLVAAFLPGRKPAAQAQPPAMPGPAVNPRARTGMKTLEIPELR